MKPVVLGGTVETARRVSSSAWNHFVNSFFLTAHFSEEDHLHGWLMLGFRDGAAVFPYHPPARRLVRCFPYTFHIYTRTPSSYTFLCHRDPALPRRNLAPPSQFSAPSSSRTPRACRFPLATFTPCPFLRIPFPSILPPSVFPPLSVFLPPLPPLLRTPARSSHFPSLPCFPTPILPILPSHLLAPLPLHLLPPPSLMSPVPLPVLVYTNTRLQPRMAAPPRIQTSTRTAHAHACASSASGWEDDPALNGWGGAGGEEGETDEGCSIYVRALVARTAVLLRAGSVEGCASARAPYIRPRWTSEADGLIFTRWTPLRGDDNRTSFRRQRDEVTRVLRRVRAAASGSMRVVGVARRLRRRARLRRPPPGQYPADSRPSRAEYGYAYYPYAGWATAYTVCPAAPIARASGLGYSRLVVYAASLPPPHRILPPPFPSLSSSPNSPFTFY
ncbi:hypothetical protein B0H16DRAFT_1837406 [Mycena metata]|uniref:Uncharacterized protein n=1 Tax=Mycena metata TaxID=1033252 RepID=A0AAD7NAA3_9AGAR|nr:hypothetical protein B0H16DRAFT_1837406 [Mycena metata]